MSNTTNLNIRIDRDLKTEADFILERMGLNLSTAVNVFVRQIVQEKTIPFKIQLCEDETLSRAKDALKDMQIHCAANGISEMTIEEIDSEIAAYRREKLRGLNKSEF